MQSDSLSKQRIRKCWACNSQYELSDGNVTFGKLGDSEEPCRTRSKSTSEIAIDRTLSEGSRHGRMQRNAAHFIGIRFSPWAGRRKETLRARELGLGSILYISHTHQWVGSHCLYIYVLHILAHTKLFSPHSLLILRLPVPPIFFQVPPWTRIGNRVNSLWWWVLRLLPSYADDLGKWWWHVVEI